jgi:hypothetical protein
MSTKYKIQENESANFITTTIVGWIGTSIYSAQVFLHKNKKLINPVKARIVEFPEHYLYISARNKAVLDGLIPVVILNRSWRFVS